MKWPAFLHHPSTITHHPYTHVMNIPELDLKEYRVDAGKAKKGVKLKDFDTKAGDKNAREKIEAETAALQLELGELQERLYAEGKQSLLLVLQARDAGGKDGTVKHVLAGINPQGVIVTSFKVPTSTEAKHDFLWRVHAHAPEAGMMAVFNRSHYEEVLVTRVHGTVSDEQAEQNFKHIRAFEELLADRGTRILKVYLHISADEQKERLQDRLDNPDKHWKFNVGDLAERARWDDYTRYYEDMMERTSTDAAPWYVIPADRKWYRDRLISQLLFDTLQDMNPQYPQADLDPKTVVIE